MAIGMRQLAHDNETFINSNNAQLGMKNNLTLDPHGKH